MDNARSLAIENENIFVINGKVQEHLDVLINYKFDFIILSSLLHEVENPDEILKSIYTISHKDTVIYADVPQHIFISSITGMEIGILNNLSDKTEMGAKI